MTKELAKKESTEVSTEVVEMREQEVLSTDMPIPRLYLMQKTSDLVETGEARIGDFVRSTNNEKLGDTKTVVEFIPLKMTTEWSLEEKMGDRFQWRERVERNAGNENLPYLFEKNGTQWRRVKVINVFALLPGDIIGRAEKVRAALEAGELPEPLSPIVISFRSTSFTAGRKVAQFFVQVQEAAQYKQDVAPYQYTLPLGNERQENEKGSFQVMTVGKPKKIADQGLLVEAGKMYKFITEAASLKVDVDMTEDQEDDWAARRANDVRKRESNQF